MDVNACRLRGWKVHHGFQLYITSSILFLPFILPVFLPRILSLLGWAYFPPHVIVYFCWAYKASPYVLHFYFMGWKAGPSAGLLDLGGLGWSDK